MLQYIARKEKKFWATLKVNLYKAYDSILGILRGHPNKDELFGALAENFNAMCDALKF